VPLQRVPDSRRVARAQQRSKLRLLQLQLTASRAAVANATFEACDMTFRRSDDGGRERLAGAPTGSLEIS